MKNLYIHYHISLISPYNEKCFRSSCRGNKEHNFYDHFFITNRAVYGIMWENMVQRDRTEMAI